MVLFKKILPFRQSKLSLGSTTITERAIDGFAVMIRKSSVANAEDLDY